MYRPTIRDWERLPEDPDPVRDLGYEMIELDVIDAADDGSSQLLILPRDEGLLREQAFIVADQASVCDLETQI